MTLPELFSSIQRLCLTRSDAVLRLERVERADLAKQRVALAALLQLAELAALLQLVVLAALLQLEALPQLVAPVELVELPVELAAALRVREGQADATLVETIGAVFARRPSRVGAGRCGRCPVQP